MKNKRTTNPHVAVRAQTGISPEEARSARARAWKFIFDRYREKATRTDGGEDTKKEVKDKFRGTTRMPC